MILNYASFIQNCSFSGTSYARNTHKSTITICNILRSVYLWNT